MSSLVTRDKAVVWHPYTQSGFAIDPLPVVSARGSSLVLEDGRKILDGIASWWCCLHGHGHPVLVRAAAEQFERLDHVIFAGVTHEPAVRLAERLCEVVPHGFQRVFYSDNGSTAVEVALKLAVQRARHRGERRITFLALEGAYHGDTFGAMAVGARSIFSAPFEEMLFSVEFLPPEGSERDLERARAVCRGGDVAGFIFEPLVQGVAGMRMHDVGMLDRYASIVREYGGLCIADEVMTGFGRTGELFASGEMKVAPDIICLSKGLTSGTLPLAVTMCREDLFNEFISKDHSRTFFHGHTYTANPIACAVALASLDITTSQECAEARAQIAASHRGFIERLRGEEGISSPRAQGTIVACDLETKESGGYQHTAAQRARDFFIERGVLLRPLGNVVYFMPPYCVSDDELRRGYEAIVEFARSSREDTFVSLP
jgi:adenosylmethionine-8-amino-7-oxononanoate aminotransferase